MYNIREGVPYGKVYSYNPKCPKLNGYGDNGQRKVWSSSGQLTRLINVCPRVWCGVTSVPGLKAAIFWLAAQCLNLYATALSGMNPRFSRPPRLYRLSSAATKDEQSQTEKLYSFGLQCIFAGTRFDLQQRTAISSPPWFN
jgi:hypothetical protein